MKMDELSLLWHATGLAPKGATCRTCKHRIRFELNYHSLKVVQCCGMQPSRRSNSGYKIIKVKDAACYMYKKED